DRGQAIRIGPFRIRGGAAADAAADADAAGRDRAGPADGPDPLRAPPAPQPDLPGVVLETRTRTRPPQPRMRLGRVLSLLGRGPACSVRLVDASVARHHCSLVRTPAGPWVVDL